MKNTIKTTARGTQYLDKISVFNGDECQIVANNLAEAIIDNTYTTKLALVNAFQQIGIVLDPNKRISVEDSEMTQFHYFA